MPLEGSYAVWNNRGGSGKTTLTYHLANKYASKHPDKTVLLIDMCPQADLSHAFLGDDEKGVDYVSQLASLKKDPMLIGEERIAKTVSGYLDLATSINFSNLNVDPRTFLINVSKFNSQLTRNLYLLCGDPSLELVAKSLEHKRDQHFSLSQYGLHAWKSVTICLQQFIQRIAERKGIKLVVFIDMNSTFSILTEIALAASDKLLIPITEDHIHRNGFEYLFTLLYGFSQPSNVYYYYRHFSFYFRAKQHEIKLPKIHLILNKRKSNPNNESVSEKGSKTTTNDINRNEAQWMFIFELFKKHPQAFNIQNQENIPKNLSDFKEMYVMDIFERLTSNKFIRQSVRSHSPLMNSKHIRTCSHTNDSSTNISYSNKFSTAGTPINSSCSNGIIATSANSKSSYQLNRPASPTQNHLFMAIVPRSLSSSNRPFTFKNRITNSLSKSNRNLNSDSSTMNTPGSPRSEHPLNLGNKTDSATASISNNKPHLLSTADVSQDDSDHSDAILYDNMLDKIVDGLDAPK